MRILITNILMGLLFISCQKSKDIEPTYLPEDGQQPTASANNTTPNPVADLPNAQMVPPGGSTKMNPEHGQPGHRCDIPVGSPLNSPKVENPKANPNTQTIEIDPNNLPKQVKATTKVAAGMNPAHGEPGHRCDIPVGQPLNSKPKKAATTEAKPIKIEPTVQQKQVDQVTLAPGTVNPAHGEPGHRCDVAVGQAIPEKN